MLAVDETPAVAWRLTPSAAAPTAEAAPAAAVWFVAETASAVVEALTCGRVVLRPLVAAAVVGVTIGMATGRCWRLVRVAGSEGLLSGALRVLGLP